MEAADPDADASGRTEPVQLHAEWASVGEPAPGWTAATHWTAEPSAEPRLILTLSPPVDAVPGAHTLLVGATDARGLTSLRTLSVEVLSARATGGPGGAVGGPGASDEAGSKGPGVSAPVSAAGSPGAWLVAASTEEEPHMDGPVPVYVVEPEGDSAVSGSGGQQGSAGWSVALALNDTAGGGALLSDGYLTAAERTSGAGASAVKILLSIDDPTSIGSFAFGYAKLRSDPGACAATSGAYRSSTGAGLKFSDLTSDGPYFFCLRAGDGTNTSYAGPVGFFGGHRATDAGQRDLHAARPGRREPRGPAGTHGRRGRGAGRRPVGVRQGRSRVRGRLGVGGA